MSGYIGTQPVPQATQTRDSFTATSGQTSFATSGYTPNFLDVFLNGVKLAAADYTASNGSDVVLATGATTGDILEVVAYTTFDTANVTGAANFTVTGSFTSQGIDDNANATAITIDSSENVLVGKTSSSHAIEGGAIFEDGRVYSTVSNLFTFTANRLNSDGEIIRIQKDTSTVGSIFSGHGGSQVGIGTNTTGITFNPATRSMMPANPSSTNPQLDATLDIGFSSVRWKDLYLSGGVFLGGTGSANKLEDYEEGEFDVSLTPNAGGSITMQNNRTKAKYTKIGNLVTVSGQIRTASVSNMSGDHIYMSLPYAISSGSDLSSHGWSHVVIYGSSYTNRDMGLWTFDGSSTARFLDSTYVNIPQNVFNGGEEIIFTLSYKTA